MIVQENILQRVQLRVVTAGDPVLVRRSVDWQSSPRARHDGRLDSTG